MSIQLELSPEIESLLQEEAAKRGQEAAEYAKAILEERLRPAMERPFYETATKEEWLERFHQFIESHRDITGPPPTAEALRRESWYEDRGA